MGVEEIVAIIEREADEEATRILDDAEQQASELVAAAEAGVQAQVDAAIDRLGPEIRAAAQRRVNAVRLRILEDRARADATRLMAVFDTAEEQVASVAGGADPSRWAADLSGLCAEALGSVGEGASVVVRAKDVEAIRGVAEARHADVVVLAEQEEPGLVARSADGRIEVDARLSTRSKRARSLLAEIVAQQLRLGSADREQGTVA